MANIYYPPDNAKVLFLWCKGQTSCLHVLRYTYVIHNEVNIDTGDAVNSESFFSRNYDLSGVFPAENFYVVMILADHKIQVLTYGKILNHPDSFNSTANTFFKIRFPHQKVMTV